MTREEIIKGLYCGYSCTEKDECFEGGCKGCIELMLDKYEQQIRTDVIDELLNVCGGKDEDCELCTFAIFRDDINVSCKLIELKEQNK